MTPGWRASAISAGCSSRHGAHHDAKKLTRVTPPSRSLRANPCAVDQPWQIEIGGRAIDQCRWQQVGSWLSPTRKGDDHHRENSHRQQKNMSFGPPPARSVRAPHPNARGPQL